jgi:F0F1-type ATP synthase delta subunit
MKIDASFRSRLKKKLLTELATEQKREVVVRSVLPLTESQLKELVEAVPTLSQAEIRNEIDASLIGGLVLIDGSKIIDMSIKGSLQGLVATLI